MLLDSELQTAVRAARLAGQRLMEFFGKDYDIHSKGHDNPLTEADLASNRALEESLRAAYPGDGWLSEETADSPERLARERVWIVDPLDGTKDFIEGVAQFSVSIGLAVEGRALLGVVYNPARDEMFSGIVGEGAWLGESPIRASSRADLSGARILASRSETKRGEFAPFEQDMEIEAVGSIAYKLALVAAGRGDASFSLGPKHEWDVCGGAALVEAAGGRAGARDGKPLSFNQQNTLTNGILVSGAALYHPLVERCAPLLKQYEFRFHERRSR